MQIQKKRLQCKVRKVMAKTTNLYAPELPDINRLSQAELAVELEKGYQDVLQGHTKPASEVFTELREAYNL